MPPVLFSDLPAEIRLEIAAYVVEQSQDTGLFYQDAIEPENTGIVDMFCDEATVPGWRVDCRYSPANNLSLLLVCRQFHADFQNLAYQRTRFVLLQKAVPIIHQQPARVLSNLRRLVLYCDLPTLASWDQYLFNDERLQLDELCIALCVKQRRNEKYPILVKLLRTLQNVKAIRFVLHPGWQDRIDGNALIGAILKEDHYQRYDAPNAPNLETTWWTWSQPTNISDFLFVAQQPKPLMDEQTYMKFAKPKIDEAILNMAAAHTGQL
ncbi:hypothetical protein ACN47E_007563 [Coniothyrium glycines]